MRRLTALYPTDLLCVVITVSIFPFCLSVANKVNNSVKKTHKLRCLMSKDPKHLHLLNTVVQIIRDILQHMDRVIRLLFSLHMDCYSPFPIYLQDSRQKSKTN